MASNILSIGQSALSAAQVGISVTGHNIANAATPGFSRQVVVQGAAEAQNFGYGYLGQGTQINTVQRMYSELNNRVVMNSQSSSSEVDAHHALMQRIDNLLADSSSGLSTVTNDFFSSLQSLSSSPSDTAARQAMMSSANALAQRFQSLDSDLKQVNQDVNSEIKTSVDLINSYAKQIAKLNDVIEKALSADGNPPNDLMDQRDELVSNLSKEIKSTVVSESGGKVNVFIGNGMPLVVGKQTYTLATLPSPTDGTRVEIAYQNKDKLIMLGENSLPGGKLGGLIDFRNNSLDSIQNQLDHIAVVMADTFNTQHKQGLDLNGKVGGDFFVETTPMVTKSSDNQGDAVVSANVSDINATLGTNYRLTYDGTNYIVTRTDTNESQSFSSLPQTVDGLNIQIDSGSMTSGDDFLIQPGRNAAAKFDLAFANITKIAVGAPVVAASALSTNTGSATAGPVMTNSSYSGSPLVAPFVLSYDSSTGTFNGFPSGEPINVTDSSGTVTSYPADSSVPYTAGSTFSVANMSFKITGTPANGDQFSYTASAANAPGDNRNALLLANLRTSHVMNGSSTTYEGAFGELVSFVGSKTNELGVMSTAEDKMLEQAVATQQSVAGVNLDEEATNLLRYQQAYQSAAKMMQIASQMFDALLQLGK